MEDKIIVTVFNKIDQKEDGEFPRDLQSDYQVQISAKTGAGDRNCLDTLEQILRSQKVYLERCILLPGGRQDPDNPQVR